MLAVPSVAVGGPHIVTGEGWDAAPLLLAVLLVVLLRWIAVPVRLPTVIAAVFAGLLLDLVSDVFRVSIFTVIALLLLAFTLVSLRRASAS
jgi:hypothetical protein